MSLRDDAKLISAQYNSIKHTLTQNAELLEIQEGNLLCYVERELSGQLSANAFEIAKKRIPPINVQKRVIDKLSQIYAKPPERKMPDNATDTDKANWDWYVKSMSIDVSGSRLNEYFNLNKASAWEPFMDADFMPRLREIPYDRFFVMATDPSDSLRMTHFIKVMGYVASSDTDGKPCQKRMLYCYTATEFLVILEDGEVADEFMNARNLQRVHAYGRIPFVYVNRSKMRVNPMPDTDMYRMTTLIPVLFTDVNYAMMFQAFSVWYGINVDMDKIPINPNLFINLKADPNNPGVKPEIGTVKPDLDSDKAISAAQEQLSLWLQSRNIRPGTVGRLSADNFNSGISKMIDEMDTSGDRQKQIPYFVDAEEDLFDLVAYHMHPVWSRSPSYKQKAQFSKELEYQVKFPFQISWQTRKEILDELKVEMDMGLISRKDAIQRLNPEMPESNLDEMLQEIEDENTSVVDTSNNGQEANLPA